MNFVALAPLFAFLPTFVTAAGSGNPYDGATVFLVPEYVDKVNVAVAQIPNACLAAAAAQISDVPVFFWMDVAAKVKTLGAYLATADAEGPNQLVQAVIYDLPDRDCAAAASAGEFSIANGGAALYQAYIDNIAAQVEKFPNVRVVFVIEPDGLVNSITNLSVHKCDNAALTYKKLVSYAISKLQQDNVWLYLDAGHAGWPGLADVTPAAQAFAQVLSGAGPNATVRGLATDVSNYNPLRGPANHVQTPRPNYEELYINALAPLLIQHGFPAHFIVDQSRAGVPDLRSTNWCNVVGAGLGMRPTTDTQNDVMDAIVVKPPGESDGTSDSTAQRFDLHCAQSDAAQPAPEAGTWFQNYFETLIQNANPPL